MTSAELWRLRRSAALHGLAVVTFTLLALSGTSAAALGLYGLAVPLIVTGAAGAAGAAVITVAVWRWQGVEPGTAVPAGVTAQRTPRLVRAAAAVVVVISGVLLAPQGVDRGFVIWVAALLAAALALFALLAGERPRTAE
jgi:hypothetical protein